jgi:bifunctional DNA-binding transcriptional regulator/antitoxin component of YhaV-PrlF toxin-antitoxin module
VRKKLGVGQGDQVEFVFEAKRIVVRSKPVSRRFFTEWVGALAKPGERVSVEDIKHQCRQIREDRFSEDGD